MAKIVNATCVSSGEKKDTDYGERVVADFEAPEDDDIAIWVDYGTDEGDALMNLAEGQDVTLVYESQGDKSYYTLEEGEQEALLQQGRASNQSSSQQQSRSSGGQQQSSSGGPSRKEIAREILSDSQRLANLEIEVYTTLRDGFREREGDVPPPKALAALTSTVIINTTKAKT